MTSRPMVLVVGEELLSSQLLVSLDSRGWDVQVASKLTEPLANSPVNTRYSFFDYTKARDSDLALQELIRPVELVLCLISGSYQSEVLRICIDQRKHMVTPLLLHSKARRMEHEALEVGVTILSEVGLAPGLDHVIALALLERMSEAGQHILRFESYCGSLPQAMCANNPFHYKFSWSPVEVLSSVVKTARFIENDQLISIPGSELMQHVKAYSRVSPIPLESYPSEDSTAYILQYGLQGVPTYIRNVLRYAGFCKLMDGFRKIGLLDLDKKCNGITWLDVLANLVRDREAAKLQLPDWVPAAAEEVVLKIHSALMEDSIEDRLAVVQALNYIGALATTQVDPHPSILHAFSSLCLQSLPFKPGDKDFLLLEHVVTYESNGANCELRATLEVEGEPGECSAITRLAGVHMAAAVQWIHSGASPPGLMLPLVPGYSNFVLKEMQQEGIFLTEKNTTTQPSIA